MPRSFHLFEEIADVIDREAGPQLAQISSLDDKWRPVDTWGRCQ